MLSPEYAKILSKTSFTSSSIGFSERKFFDINMDAEPPGFDSARGGNAFFIPAKISGRAPLKP